MNIGKFIGCVMMVVGSAIGAGILGLPIVSAGAGFAATLVVMLLLWLLLTITGLMVAEASLMLPAHACSFNSMAEKTLGPFGRIVTWVSYLLLLYTTLTAYISGGPDLIFGLLKAMPNLQISRWMVTIVFTIVMGGVVFWSTKATDHFNRFLIFIKGVLLLSSLALISVYIDSQHIFSGFSWQKTQGVIKASPIILCLFNYHFVIPSIRMYVGDRPKSIRWIVIIGTTISLVIYLFWLAPILSIIPLNGENGFNVIGNSPGELTRILTAIVNSNWVRFSVYGFANISMTTAFLGVSLGLFDFLADGLKRANDRFGRFQTALATFLPPLLVNIFYPDNFLKSFSYSGVFVAILFLILPPIILKRLRHQCSNNLHSSVSLNQVHCSCGKVCYTIIVVFGVVFTIFPILTNAGIF